MLQPSRGAQAAYFPGFFLQLARNVGTGFVWTKIPCCATKDMCKILKN
jgi:hypothetical protein